MRAWLKPTRRLVRRILIVLLVLTATVNAAAFLLTPLLDRYREPLAELVSEHIGRPIHIGAMRARWRGFGPEMVLQDLTIGATDAPDRIRLADVALDFGIWDMLRYQDLSPLRITLRDLEVHLIRDPEGKLHLAGFEGLGDVDTSEAGGLPLQGRLRLENVTVLWEDQRLKLPVRRLEGAELRLHLWPDRLSMSASVRLPGDAPGRLRAAAELDLAGSDWSGEIYLAGNLPEAGAQLGPYLPAPLRLTQGGIRIEAWTDWENSRLATMEGRLRVEDLLLDRGPDTPALALQAIASQFRYQREGEDRQVDLAELTLARDGHQWPVGDLHLSLNLAHPGLPAVRLSAQYLRLDDLLALTRPAPLPPAWQALRDGLAPDAELRDLRFDLEPGEGPARWRLATRFDHWHNAPWGDYPGVHGLQGNVQGDQQALAMELTGSGGDLALPTLFRAPLPYTRLAGRLVLHGDRAGGYTIAAPSLVLDTPDLASTTRLLLHLPAGGPADIDLQTDFANVDISQISRYLPPPVLGEELTSWIDDAFSDGRVPQGNLLLRGPLRDFPFDKQRNGRFQVRFDVRDLTLNYQTGWPPLVIGDAEVEFHNNSLDIRLAEGRIYASELRNTTASIRSVDPTSELLVKGEVVGPLSDPLRLLAESPLKERFGDLGKALRGQGRSHLTLDFALVLDELGKDRLDGELRLRDAALSVPDWDLTLAAIDGALRFDLDGIRAEGLRANLLGRPVTVNISPKGASHRVAARARIDPALLRQHLPELPEGLLDGSTELDLVLDIANRPGARQLEALRLVSDLDGMAVKLPAPLGKPADSKLGFDLALPLADPDAPYALTYGDQVRALFRPGADRAAIRFGGDPAELPDEPVLQVSGRLSRLELDPWLALTEQPGSATGGLPPLRTELQLGQLQLGRTRIDDVHVALRQVGDGWSGEARAPTFAGRFTVPAKDSGEPVQLELERLAIEFQGEAPDAAGADPGKPSDWPPLDLTIVSLQINGNDFGRLTARARHVDGSLRLQPLTLNGPLASFDGLAQWRGEGQTADSDLVGKLSTPALGKLLPALGYSPQFAGAPMEADISLSWPGSLSAFDRAKLRGQLSLAVKQGQLLEVKPGVGRALGLLNFGALQRRLRLDFSDLYKEGMAFDSITGSFRLIDGNAYTQDLTVKGPSGDILITGRTGLGTQDLYQEVTVTPRFDATLPVAGTLAGGPIAGIAVLVAQTVMKEKVDQFNQIRYQVSGSWDDPKVEQLKDGGALSKILKPVTELFKTDSDADAEDTAESAE